jgi:hypothetical protein
MGNHKNYARYYIVRDNQALWRGGPAESGAQFRQVVITSNEWNSTHGLFQVYAIEGTGKGILEGKLAVSDQEPTLLFDGDFQGLDAATKECNQLMQESLARGFKPVTSMDDREFRAKLKGA